LIFLEGLNPTNRVDLVQSFGSSSSYGQLTSSRHDEAGKIAELALNNNNSISLNQCHLL
jgi:hypothetical protein